MVDLGDTAGQQAAEDLRQLQTLGDRLGVANGGVAPQPATAGEAGGGAEKAFRRRQDRRQFCAQVLVVKLCIASMNRTVPDLLRITIECVVAPVG